MFLQFGLFFCFSVSTCALSTPLISGWSYFVSQSCAIVTRKVCSLTIQKLILWLLSVNSAATFNCNDTLHIHHLYQVQYAPQHMSFFTHKNNNLISNPSINFLCKMYNLTKLIRLTQLCISGRSFILSSGLEAAPGASGLSDISARLGQKNIPTNEGVCWKHRGRSEIQLRRAGADPRRTTVLWPILCTPVV